MGAGLDAFGMNIRVDALPSAHEWSTIIPVRIEAPPAERVPLIAATALAVIALVLAIMLAS